MIINPMPGKRMIGSVTTKPAVNVTLDRPFEIVISDLYKGHRYFFVFKRAHPDKSNDIDSGTIEYYRQLSKYKSTRGLECPVTIDIKSIDDTEIYMRVEIKNCESGLLLIDGFDFKDNESVLFSYESVGCIELNRGESFEFGIVFHNNVIATPVTDDDDVATKKHGQYCDVFEEAFKNASHSRSIPLPETVD